MVGPAGSQQLEILPWDGSAAVSVTGLPADLTFPEEIVKPAAGSVSLVTGVTSASWSGSAWLLVDTASGEGWVVDPTNANCLLPQAEAADVNDGTLVWQSRTKDASGNDQLCTTPVPAPGDTSVAEPTVRPSVTLPATMGTPDNNYRFIPEGADVLVTTTMGSDAQWGDATDMPLESVDPQGNVSTIRQWAYQVIPASSGHVVAATGDAPGVESIDDIDVSTGTGTTVLPITSVEAWIRGIAVDGNRVVSTDNSAFLGAVRQTSVDFGAGNSSASTVLDTNATGPVAAGFGATDWETDGYQNVYARHLTSGGSLTSGGGLQPLQTDDRWVMSAPGVLYDTTDRSFLLAYSRYYTPVLQDGVMYYPGDAIPSGPPNAVVARDAATDRATAITVPPCIDISSVQVAGSWLAVYCETSPERGTTSSWISAICPRPTRLISRTRSTSATGSSCSGTGTPVS